MTGRTPGQRPTAERLLAVRTPMEIAFALDGSRFAFTLQEVASGHGVTQPSDLWVVEGDADPVRLTDGRWADTSPIWSPDGSRLAFLSDRAVAGHHLPYTMVPGEAPVIAASFPGSAEQLVWSADGHRLLVLAADPGSYSRGVSGTLVTGGASELEPGIRRSSGAWRRLLMVDLTTGGLTDVGPPGVPPELARFDPHAADWVRLTSFNDEIVDGVQFPDVRTIRWTSTDGREIEGRRW